MEQKIDDKNYRSCKTRWCYFQLFWGLWYEWKENEKKSVLTAYSPKLFSVFSKSIVRSSTKHIETQTQYHVCFTFDYKISKRKWRTVRPLQESIIAKTSLLTYEATPISTQPNKESAKGLVKPFLFLYIVSFLARYTFPNNVQ